MQTELSYPLGINAYGDIEVTSDYATQVKQAILSCLYTVRGERVYRDLYGLQPQLFTTDRLSQIRTVKEALKTISDEYPDVPYRVTGYLADGVSIVQVHYSVDGTDFTEQLKVAI